MLLARMAAKSSGGGAGSPYSLSGTSGSPNVASDDQADPTNATTSWTFNTDGTVDRTQFTSTVQFQSGVEWTSDQPTPSEDMWVRATLSAGDSPTSGTVGSWLKVAGTSSANRTWSWVVTSPGSLNGTLKIELSRASDGTDIVATGYYRGNSTVF